MDPDSSYIKRHGNNTRLVKKVAAICLGVNFLVGLAKVIVGIAFWNVAMLSDAASSVVDMTTTALVLLTTFISSPKEDRKFNYGREKREQVLVLFLSLIIFVTAGVLVWQGVAGLVNISPAYLNWWLVGVAIASIMTKELQYHIAIRYAKKTGSSALRADAWGSRTDALTSVGVLIGYIASHFTGNDMVESIAILLVAIFVARVAFKILRGSYNQLVDKAAKKEDYDKIRDIIADVEGVKCIDQMQTRMVGDAVLVDIEIGVDENLTVKEANEIVEEIEDKLEEMDDVVIKDCDVHINPVKPGVRRKERKRMRKLSKQDGSKKHRRLFRKPTDIEH